MGSCGHCPEVLVELDAGVEATGQFVFQEWKKAPVPRLNQEGKMREMFTLHNTFCTIEEAVALLKGRVKELKAHIFVAYNQWEVKRVIEQSLKPGTVMIVDDYQQNLTVELEYTSTSTV